MAKISLANQHAQVMEPYRVADKSLDREYRLMGRGQWLGAIATLLILSLITFAIIKGSTAIGVALAAGLAIHAVNALVVDRKGKKEPSTAPPPHES